MNELETRILNFIEIFQPKITEELFTACACYWFAHILVTRFENEGGRIVYNPHEIHFAASINGNIYDITGRISDEEYRNNYVWWEDYYRKFHEDDVEMIKLNCIDMIY